MIAAADHTMHFNDDDNDDDDNSNHKYSSVSGSVEKIKGSASESSNSIGSR